MNRVTVTVAVNPNADFSLDDARSFAAYLEEDLGVLMTYNGGRQDSESNPVWVASAPKPDAWLAKAQSPFGDRPAIDTENEINMTGAERAYNALVIWDGETAIPQSAPGTITAIAGMDGADALDAMGVTQVEVDEPL